MSTTTRGNKPPFADAPLWGGTSTNISKPTTTLLNDGYATQSQPGSANWNWITNFLSAGVTHCFVYGIPEYDAAEIYTAYSYINRNGVIYKSRVGSNTGNTPESSPTQWHDTRQPLATAYSSSDTHTPGTQFNEVIQIDTSSAEVDIALGSGQFNGQTIAVEVSGSYPCKVTASGPVVQTINTGQRKIFRWNGTNYSIDVPMSKSPVSPWDPDEASAYNTAGVVIQGADGVNYTSSGLTGNSNKDPVDPDNVDYWFPSPGYDVLNEAAKTGKPVRGHMHKVNDRSDGDYQTSLLLDKFNIGGTVYEFYRVALDGSTVTGNTTLETILGTTGTPYKYVDQYAPDDVGTRTLIDMGGHVTEAMTNGSGVVPTLAELHDDYMQRITGYSEYPGMHRNTGDMVNSGVFSTRTTASLNNADGTTNTTDQGIDFDSANSTSPNAAKTNDDRTAHAALVTGIDYIIVMKAA